MNLNIVYDLAQANAGMTTVDRLVNIYHVMSAALIYGVEGDVVELGANAGLTSVFLQKVIQAHAPSRILYVFDSFEGMPAPGPEDVTADKCEPHFKQGDCRASADALLENFRHFDAPPPVVVAGWFSDTLPQQLPERIAFAYIDADLYESTAYALASVVPRMAAGGAIVIDDYCNRTAAKKAWSGLPGVEKACSDLLPGWGLSATALVGETDLSFGLVRIPR